MRDETDGRIWADHHGQISDGVDQLLAALLRVFCRITAIQFKAPWRKHSPEC